VEDVGNAMVAIPQTVDSAHFALICLDLADQELRKKPVFIENVNIRYIEHPPHTHTPKKNFFPHRIVLFVHTMGIQ